VCCRSGLRLSLVWRQFLECLVCVHLAESVHESYTASVLSTNVWWQ
jgi:hypothetical protein